MPIRLPAIFSLALSVWATTAPTNVTGTQDGRHREPITFAQSACFTGPCGETGQNFRAGILTAFHEHNKEAGTTGAILGLISRDDAYDAVISVANAAEFVDNENVFAVIGVLGTPTAQRMVPVLRMAGMPVVGILSGADFLRNNEIYSNVVHLRSSYSDEVRQLVRYMYEDIGARRFGIIYQEDSLGRSILSEYHEALKEYDLPILAKASYTWHTHSVHGTLFTMEKADLDVVMMAATTSNTSDAIDFSRALGGDYMFGILSIVNLEQLEEKVGSSLGPAVAARVMPDVENDDIPLVARYRSAFESYRDEVTNGTDLVIDESGLEGYVLGRFVIAVLDQVEGKPSREEFLMTALTGGPYLIDGWEISFDEGSNVGSDYVRLIEFSGNDQPEREAVR